MYFFRKDSLPFITGSVVRNKLASRKNINVKQIKRIF